MNTISIICKIFSNQSYVHGYHTKHEYTFRTKIEYKLGMIIPVRETAKTFVYAAIYGATGAP